MDKDSTCYWVLRHQNTITQHGREERFEECLGIPQAGFGIIAGVGAWEGIEARQAVHLMQKRL